MPAGAALFSLSLPGDPLEIDIDSVALSSAIANALVCTALLADRPLSAAAATVCAERIDGALFIDLPALPGSSALVLLDLALRGRGLPGGQFVEAPGGARLRLALPLAARLPQTA